MFISFTRKYNRLLIWEHVLCLSRLSYNIVTRSMWLEPTFPGSTHFEAELIFNSLFQRGRSLRLTFQRIEPLLCFGTSNASAPACLLQKAAYHKTFSHWRIQPPGCMFFIQSNPVLSIKQSQPCYGLFHLPLLLEKVKTLPRLSEPCLTLRNSFVIACTEMKQME